MESAISISMLIGILFITGLYTYYAVRSRGKERFSYAALVVILWLTIGAAYLIEIKLK